MEDNLLTPSEAGHRCDLGPDRMRQLADNGTLPVVRTRSGIRLFRESDVERFARQRQRARRNPGR
jgi:DNA-binding transcriptional MerR regulator